MKNTQRPSGMPIHRYTPYAQQFEVALPDRGVRSRRSPNS